MQRAACTSLCIHTHSMYQSMCQKTTTCVPSTQQYGVSIECGPSSVIGRVSGGEESTANKPLVLKIVSHKVHAYYVTITTQPLLMAHACVHLVLNCMLYNHFMWLLHHPPKASSFDHKTSHNKGSENF